MCVVYVYDGLTGDRTRIGFLPYAKERARLLKEYIEEENLHNDGKVLLCYNDEIPYDIEDEEVERAHAFSQALSMFQGWI